MRRFIRVCTCVCIVLVMVLSSRLASAQTTRSIFSNLTNPSIGMNALFSGQIAPDIDAPYGIQFDSAELSAISVVGWGLECVGYWLILTAFPGVDASLQLCVFLWSATTLAGALSFLPGGLGGFEATMVLLLGTYGVDVGSAAFATTVIRLTTLWFSVALGGGVLAYTILGRKLVNA